MFLPIVTKYGNNIFHLLSLLISTLNVQIVPYYAHTDDSSSSVVSAIITYLTSKEICFYLFMSTTHLTLLLCKQGYKVPTLGA